MNRRFVSLALLLAFTVTSAAPAFGLRQTGLEESPEQRDRLAKALQDRNDPVGAVAATVASGLSRFLQPTPALPTATGMEEWVAIASQALPAGLWRDLGAYGVGLVGVEYRVLSPPTKGDRREALQPFAHDGADVAITASVNDGLGSVLFHGIGKDQPPERIEVHKITVDGNAVFMGYHSLIDYTLRHRDVALLIRGDEGEQDASIALRVGSIFFRGEVIKFKDLPTLRAELRRLRELRDDDAPNGVTIRGVIGDALEVTTKLVVGDQDSWGLVAIVDLPQDPESLEKITLIPDHLRRSGWLYRAPRPIPVDQLNPFMPPTEGFPLIGLANGIDPAQDAAGYAGWMARQGLVTLGGEHPALGPKRGTRPFLNAIRSDGGKLAEAYPGFDPYPPTDGTVAPAFFTAHGIEVNGRTYALDVRHGYNEAEIVQVFVKNAGPSVHYVHTDTSPKGTKKATSLTKQTAHNYTADERSGASGFGLGAERLEAFDTEENSGYTGVVAMTSVNGVTKRLAGGLAGSIQGIQFILDPSGYGGRIVTHTLVSARDGSSYIVRSTFRADDLPEAKEWIKLASRLPSPVPPPLEKPTGEVQTLDGLAGVVAPGNIGFVQGRAQQEVSRTFRYLLPQHLAKLMGELGIGYHLTFLHPGQIGQAEEAEFYRTRGHFHSEPVAELVEIYDGRGEVLLWETQPTDRALATRAVLLSVNAGDIFFVPWGWGHMSLNRDPGQMLVFGTWLKQGVRLDYPDASLRGAPYFIGPEPAGNRGNGSYASVPDLAVRVPNLDYMKPSLEIPDDRSLWSVAITDEARFIRILKHLLVPSHPALRPGLLFTADAAAGMEEVPALFQRFLHTEGVKWELGEGKRIYVRYERPPEDEWNEGSNLLLQLADPAGREKLGISGLQAELDTEENRVILTDSEGKIHRALRQAAGMEESPAIREAEGEVRTLEIQIAQAEREGDTGLAGILGIGRVNAEDRLSRLRAEAERRRRIPEDAGPKLVFDDFAGMEEAKPAVRRVLILGTDQQEIDRLVRRIQGLGLQLQVDTALLSEAAPEAYGSLVDRLGSKGAPSAVLVAGGFAASEDRRIAGFLRHLDETGTVKYYVALPPYEPHEIRQLLDESVPPGLRIGPGPGTGMKERVRLLRDTEGLVTVVTTPRDSAGRLAKRQADISRITTLIQTGGSEVQYLHPDTYWAEAMERHNAVLRTASAAREVVAAKPTQFLAAIDSLFKGPLIDDFAGMEEVWVLPVEPIENVVEAVLRFTKGSGTDAPRLVDWVSFFGRDMRYRMQGVYFSEDTNALQGRLKRVAREGSEARYIRLAVKNGILNVDPALRAKPKMASAWRPGAQGESPLRIIFRPENAGLAFLLPERGVDVRVVVADLAQHNILLDLRPDLAGRFIQADESGGVDAALRQARQELGWGAIEVNLDLSHNPATLAAQIQRWLKRFPWKHAKLTDQVTDAVLAGTQA